MMAGHSRIALVGRRGRIAMAVIEMARGRGGGHFVMRSAGVGKRRK
jgi:hypothetical protein